MRLFSLCFFLFTLLCTASLTLAQDRSFTDSNGREVTVPERTDRVICSGPGCLRLLTYLEAQNLAVAADDIESRRRTFDARPYAIANPQFKKLPLFGQFRGNDNPELIMALEPQPQVIFKTYGSSMGYDPDELQQKTGIPVVVLNYGDLGTLRPQLYKSLRLMGEVVGKQNRAEAVINYMESLIKDLQTRTASVQEEQRPSVFVGGVAFKGPHGYQSTEPGYPPFSFVNAHNLAWDEVMSGKELRHSNVSKEMILQWNPDVLFLDLSTLQMGDQAGGLFELRTDPAYQALTAVQEGKVYGLLPYNWYTQNFGSILANAYFIGKTLYPERFQDVAPAAKADEIFSFLVGKPVFPAMNEMFQQYSFTAIPVQ